MICVYGAAVSLPRQLLPMDTYFVTRRVIFRHMLLRPDREMNEILSYFLALMAHRYGVEVHGFCAMSTHIHLVVTDVRGNLSTFLRQFHRMVAMCTKALRNWDEALWDKSPTSVVRLETEAATVEKIAYVLANPVAAGLVRRAHEWPGAKVLAREIGRGTLRGRRPDVYVDPDNWPELASLPIALPPGIGPERGDSFRRQVATEVARLETQAKAETKEKRRSVLGAARASAVSPTERATTVEPKVDRNPRFAVGRNQDDAWQRAVAALRAFHMSYRSAMERWRAGIRDVVFPPGTWWMRVFHGVQVADVAAKT